MEWIPWVTLGLEAFCFAGTLVGTVIIHRRARRISRMVADLAGGCSPHTHVWQVHGEDMFNAADNQLTILNKIECLRCGEVLSLDMRMSVRLDTSGKLLIDVATGPQLLGRSDGV